MGCRYNSASWVGLLLLLLYRRTCHSFQWLETPSKCQSEPFSRKCSFMKSTCLWFWAHCTMLGHRCAGSIVLGSTGDAWGNEVLKLQEVWNLAFHCIPCKLGWAKLSKWLKDLMGLRIVWKSQCIWNRALHAHGVAHASLKHSVLSHYVSGILHWTCIVDHGAQEPKTSQVIN